MIYQVYISFENDSSDEGLIDSVTEEEIIEDDDGDSVDDNEVTDEIF